MREPARRAGQDRPRSRAPRSAERQPGGGFRLETSQGTVEAREVVVATGGFHAPRIPAAAAGLSERVLSLHSHAYRSERELPPGAVLVVGSGQSGVQLVEELREAGRRLFLSVGSAGRMPRRYRGRDDEAYGAPEAGR